MTTSYIPRLTKRECELQNEQTLDQYKDAVMKEAKRRLEERKVYEMNTTSWHKIRTKGNFENDVTSIVYDTLDYL